MNAQLCSDPLGAGVDPMPADVAIHLQAAPWPLAPVGTKAVELAFDGGRWSADAGVVLRKDINDPLGLPRARAAVLSDPRDARRSPFPPEDLLTQRVVHMAAGDEEANDSTTRRDDPLVTLRRARVPETGAPLASPPTLARGDHRLARTALSRLALVLLEPWIASSARAPTVLVRDVEDTEDRVHGPQEPARYDGDDGGYGCLPLPLDAGLSGRLRTTICKATRCSGAPRRSVLQRVGTRLRHAWPDPLIICRGDRPCASPAVMQGSDEHPALREVTGVPSNAVVPTLARAGVAQAKRAYASRGHTGTRFHATRSQAGTWSRARRVVIKVEGCAHGVPTRLVVTARAPARTQGLSQHISGARGPMENDRTDHQLSRQSARPSCHRFAANQWRLFLQAAADIVLET